jgi:nucleotide-binding universal stress UspA family protein
MFETVLVPLDGSPLSRAILDPAIFLAKKLGSRVTLLHVLEPTVEITNGDIEAEASRQREEARPVAEEYLGRLANNLRQEGVAAETVILTGKAHEAVVSYAAERGFGLLAMATRGRSGIARALLGSVATRVLHASPCPILLVRPRRQRGFWTAPRRIKQLLVPSDGSDLAEAALPYTEELATRLALPVMLIQVIPTSVEVSMGPSTAFMWNAGTDFERRLDVLTTGYLAGIGHKMAKKGITANWDALRGKAADAIVDWAKRDGALVVMTTHGRSGLGRWVIGSVTDAVVRETKAPVLIVPPPEPPR